MQIKCPNCKRALSEVGLQHKCSPCNIGFVVSKSGLEFFGDTTIYIRMDIYAQYKRQTCSSSSSKDIHEGMSEYLPKVYSCGDAL